MQVVNLFYELARECIPVKAFRYGRAGKKGAGNEPHPLVWLDDPILLGGNGGSAPPGSTVDYTVNFDVLDIPTTVKPFDVVQGECLVIGLSMIQQLRKLSPRKYSITRWNAVSLSNYYDNDAAGMRFTLGLTQALPLNLCETLFNPAKTFTYESPLPDFMVLHPEGCAVFNDNPGLPIIPITI